MIIRAALRRVLQSLLTILGASILVFIMVRVVPGDPVQILASHALPPEIIEQQHQAFGLDKPLPVQYAIWLGRAFQGDFGVSWRFGVPASQVILERFPATFELAIVAFTIAILVGMGAGIVGATRRGTLIDHLVSGISVAGLGLPIFWVGIMLILVFAVQLHWLPTSGRGGLQHLILPSISLALWLIPPIARVSRASLIEALSAQYVTTARAKGVPESGVMRRHALRNALLPVVTLLGVQVGTLLSGAIIVEAIFAWPGVGSVTVEAVRQRDYPIVQAAVVYSVLLYVAINIAVDLLYSFIDPRVDLGR